VLAELGGAETHLLQDLTHTLRRQAGLPSMSRYEQELRECVDAEVLELVTRWVRRAADELTPEPEGAL
jgi:hypothetical protein